ncbi:ribosome maturation factor RimM [Amaricoccus sp. W119]|uniref:ribosome maturation factor RimM n=1 Tax=Amaricoccus sp. W119 TaxID=3391833 RepID=UPI0039A5C6DA
MADPRGLVCVGAIAGGFGVQGEVRLKSFCADPAAIADYAPLVTEDGRGFGLRITRTLSGAFAARLTGVSTREQAEAMKGTRLYVPRDRLPNPGEDEFYHADLIGLAVLDTGGAALGKVRAVLDHGAGDILEIARPGRPDLLLPFTRAAVPTVDLAGGRIIADPPEGLDAPADD